MATPFGMEPEEQNLALSQGLLGLGAGLLSGSFGNYGAFAPALGKGVAGFQQGYSNSIDQNLKLKLFKQNQLLQNAQIGHYQSEIDKNKAAMAEQERIRQASLGADQTANTQFGIPGTLPTQPTQSSYGVLAPPPDGALSGPSVMPAGLGATALAGGSGVVGGAAGYGATGAQAPGAASPVPVQAPPTSTIAANGDMVLPPQTVTGKYASNLLNPDWHLARAQYLYTHGDPKGAVEAVTQSQKLREEERKMTKEDESKPLEGVPGVAYNPKTGKYLKDGAPISADEVQQMKLNLAAAGAPKTTVTTNVSTEKKYGEAFAGKLADEDIKLRDAAQNAPNQAARSNRILDLVNSGKVITGTGADYRLAFGKAMGIAGLSDKETITKTEQLVSELANSMLDGVKTSGLGTGQGFTDKDAALLQAARAGTIKFEPATIKRLAEINHMVAMQTAKKWNDRVKMIPKDVLDATGVSRDPIEVPPIFGTSKGMLPQGVTIEEVK